MKLLGVLLVFGCTFGGLIMTAGMEKAMHLLTGVILPATPGEMVIIMGCAISAFLISEPALPHTPGQDCAPSTLMWATRVISPKVAIHPAQL